MRLGDVIQAENLTLVQGSENLLLTGVSDDSRQVQPGGLFIARSGSKDDGARYLMDAVTRGAGAVLLARETALPQALASCTGLAVVRAMETALDTALVGRLAASFYAHPSRQLTLVGITGTKGKTTVAYLVQQLLTRLGGKCGLIGTICIDDGATRSPAELTTPGAADFQRHLAAMVKQGCRYAVAEYSSHALHQGRVAALRTQVGVFTNLTGDHLDYHQTMDAYADAKAILLASLAQESLAVVNLDDAYAPRMLRDCQARVVGCAMQDSPQSAQARVKLCSMQARGSELKLNGPWGELVCRVPLVGAHNAMNVLQAAVVAHALCQPTAAALQRALEQCAAPPGRLEAVVIPEASDGPTVLVDYAHTFDPLEKTLQALRPLMPDGAKLICLFGCGGDRDRSKRPKMAEVACRESDLVVITSDNPRTEAPQAIVDEILRGVPHDTVIARLQGDPREPQPVDAGSVKVLVQIDRALAIRWAIALAKPGDVVLLAGKGHETYQVVGTTRHPFDDREHARAALMEKSRASSSSLRWRSGLMT